jgi:hypothetical protein
MEAHVHCTGSIHSSAIENTRSNDIQEAMFHLLADYGG